MRFARKSSWFVLGPLVSTMVCCSCSNPCESGVAMATCADSVNFEFNPPITARNEISMTVSAGDANYTATFTPNSKTGTSIDFQVALGDGGYSMSGATLLFVTPASVSYSIIADGSLVATGTVSPNYKQVNGRSSQCPDYCTQAVVDVAVTQ